MSDVDGAAIDDDEDYCYIPVELVTVPSQIGPNGIRQISRRSIPTATTSRAALEVAYLADDFE